MRWCGPVQAAPFRYAAENVEIGGRRLRERSPVMAGLVSPTSTRAGSTSPGNRTAATRRTSEFGHGLHGCLGASLARQEGEVAFAALLATRPAASRPRGLSASRAFTVRRVAALLPRVKEITVRLLDRLPEPASPGRRGGSP